MSYVGKLYIFSMYDKYIYTTVTLNGAIIEQMFHVLCFKKLYMRTPTGVTVNNINDYRQECEKAANTAKSERDALASSSTSKDVDLTDIKENPYIHTYIHTYIYTYIHTYIHT